jgi:hypothetical protein
MTKKAVLFPLVLSLMAALGVTALAKDAVVESQWLAGPLRIDGADQDWQDATFLTDEASKVRYAVRNDGKNLYIMFLFSDVMSSSTLEYTGMRVFFGPDGKKNKNLGVLFTKKPMETELIIAELEKRGQPLTEEQKAELRKQKTHVVFVEEPISDKKDVVPSDPAVKTDPPVYRSAMKQKILCCEFRIPLSRVNEARGIGTEPGKTIKLGFEWGGMTNEIMKNIMADRAASGSSARQGASGMSSSVEAGAGGEGGGSGPDFAAYNRDPRFKKHTFWVDLKLAAQGS